MDKRPFLYIKLLFVAVALTFSTVAAYADKTVADLTGEDREMYDKFRHLFVNGSPDDFYSFAEEYSKDLHEKGYMMIYYKLLSNKGFYALRHNQFYRAIHFAETLDHEVREDGASDYYYLATGLYGDIYSNSHNKSRAERYFMQALEEVGDRDVKFTMRVYLYLAEMLCLKDPQKALEWIEKSISTSKDLQNIDYLSQSLAMKAYLYFIIGDAQQFSQVYQQYLDLKNKGIREFNRRYDNILEVARLAFDKDYDSAMDKVHQGSLAVDSALAVIRIYALQGNLEQGFEAVKRRYVEMDSIYGLIQDANFNQLAAETSLMRSREEAATNRSLANRLWNWLIGLTALFLFVYIMGRRRLLMKIRAQNEELKKALVRAEESDRMKSTFIQSMSHEIRTPLNAVSGFSQVLCNPDFELSDEEKQDMQQRISSNVNLITTTINEMLELSMSESESTVSDLEKKDVLCNELGRTALQGFKDENSKDVELRFTSDVDDDFTIRTNAYRLNVALHHLLDNAVKFTDKGYVELSIVKKDASILFCVTDTGVGIKEEDRERIFETFSKVDDFKEGIGLGLPICRRLISTLGGEVALDPDYSAGCRFVVSLPLGRND